MLNPHSIFGLIAGISRFFPRNISPQVLREIKALEKLLGWINDFLDPDPKPDSIPQRLSVKKCKS